MSSELEEKMAAMAQAGAAAPNAGGVSKVRNLEDCILVDKSSMMNVTQGSDIAYVLKSGQAELAILSDTDEQILLIVKFKQLVNIKALRVRAATAPAGTESSAPKVVKLWKNSPNMDFDEAMDNNPLQEFDLSKAELEGDTDLGVDYLKFQNVDNLTIFVETNQDDEDVTFLNQIQFFGHAIDDFNMNNLKKSG